MILDDPCIPESWNKLIETASKPPIPEYRVIPVESYGLEGGYIAFEMNNPENIGICGVAVKPVEALQNLISKIEVTVH